MSKKRRIIDVDSETTVAFKRGVSVGAIMYVMELECGHKVERGPYRYGVKRKAPERGKYAICKECKGDS